MFNRTFTNGLDAYKFMIVRVHWSGIQCGVLIKSIDQNYWSKHTSLSIHIYKFHTHLATLYYLQRCSWLQNGGYGDQRPSQLAKFGYKAQSQHNYVLEFSSDESFNNPEKCISYNLIKHNRALKDYF